MHTHIRLSLVHHSSHLIIIPVHIYGLNSCCKCDVVQYGGLAPGHRAESHSGWWFPTGWPSRTVTSLFAPLSIARQTCDLHCQSFNHHPVGKATENKNEEPIILLLMSSLFGVYVRLVLPWLSPQFQLSVVELFRLPRNTLSLSCYGLFNLEKVRKASNPCYGSGTCWQS